MNDLNGQFLRGALISLSLLAGKVRADIKTDSTRVTANENGYLSDSMAMMLSAVVVTAKSPEAERFLQRESGHAAFR
ncbi:MAG: hypothetical protein J7619_29860 [Dyadobacter sp.]|uniref:hypothetical protein n=1 Tax=Dyadobacter sp. TaxID=1914288 RepID=UPI001B291495|nr:hypothetical protein [Dyadobacter sp.]MBO9616930.1 hypothetical protein [Dyadobacter sp.]